MSAPMRAGALPVCMECGGDNPDLVTGATIYPHRTDLAEKKFWRCPCGAYCGCHDDTDMALGNPCGPATRRARTAAHAAFDPLWQAKARRDNVSKSRARGAGYKWLAEQLGINVLVCHISMMDAATAWRTVEICKARGR